MTISVAIGGIVLWLVLGFAVGILSALRPGSPSDRGGMVFALIGVSMPQFLLGILLIYFFYFKFGIFPAPGYVPFTDDPLSWAWHLMLPWITLAYTYAAAYSRILRSSMLETANEQWVLLARAKGLSRRDVVRRHVIRPALPPVVTMLGMDIGLLVSGAVVVEVVFGLNGVGKARDRRVDEPRPSRDRRLRPARRDQRRRREPRRRHLVRTPRPPRRGAMTNDPHHPTKGEPVFDYGARRARLHEAMEAEGIAALYVAPSADLEYLTGVERQIPNFGEVSYAHDWITGAVLRPGHDPVFLFPRMFATFDLPHRPDGEIVIVNESDDGAAALKRVVDGIAPTGVVACGNRAPAELVVQLMRVVAPERIQTRSDVVNHLRRVKDADELAAMQRAIVPVERAMRAVTSIVRAGVSMAELVEAVEAELRRGGSRCPSFTTHMFTGLTEADFDSGGPRAWESVPEGTSIMFDFGGVVDGYCSDFGRTIHVGEPTAQYREAYDVMLEAYRSGMRAATPGTPASEVNAACRQPIEDAGYGEHFRHRMGHGIGMNVHERPFLSVEDDTPLEAGMTFTDEPSIMTPGGINVRIEDVIVCAPGGGRVLNSYPVDLVVAG